LKHGLTIEDICKESTKEYFFKASGINAQLFTQIVKRVNYELEIYSIPAAQVKKYRLAGSLMIECTVAEFIEIEQMFDVYKKLYKEESKVFYHAFLAANDLLGRPPKPRSVNDLTEKELEEWMRVQGLAKNIKTETIRKRLK